MKKMVLIPAGVVLLSLAIVFAVVPAFAHGPSDGDIVAVRFNRGG